MCFTPRCSSDSQRISAPVSFIASFPIALKAVNLLAAAAVTAPSEADETRKAYLAMTPLVKRGAGAFQVARRFWICSAVSSTLSVRLGMSKTMVSPSAIAAMGPPLRGFGSNVAGHEAVRGAAEAAVGEQRNGIAEPCADQRGGDGEHFAHAGTAFRSFVANHDDIAGLDSVFFDRSEGGFFAIEDASGCRGKFRMLWPATFMTQPSGARLPLRMTRPPVGLRGFFDVRARLPDSVFLLRRRLPAPSVFPVTVMASPLQESGFEHALGDRAPCLRRRRDRWRQNVRRVLGRQ